jgi:hypothetical protein
LDADFPQQLAVGAVETVSDAEDGRELGDVDALVAAELAEDIVVRLGGIFAMVAGDAGGELFVVAAKAEEIAVDDEVLRMQVVVVVADEEADFVEQRRDLQDQLVALGQAVFAGDDLEDLEGDVMTCSAGGRSKRKCSPMAQAELMILLAEAAVAGAAADEIGEDTVRACPGWSRRLIALEGLGEAQIAQQRGREGLGFGIAQLVYLHQWSELLCSTAGKTARMSAMGMVSRPLAGQTQPRARTLALIMPPPRRMSRRPLPLSGPVICCTRRCTCSSRTSRKRWVCQSSSSSS